MVFSINAVETGPNNFAAFLALAEATLANSTVKDTSGATASSGSSSPSSTAGSNGALAVVGDVNMGGIGMVLATVAAVVAGMLWYLVFLEGIGISLGASCF